MTNVAQTNRVFVVCGRGAEPAKLEQYFSNAFGPVTKVKSDGHKGIAWVTFLNEADAKKAVSAFPESSSTSLVDLDDGMPKRRITVVFSEETRKRDHHQQQPSATTVTTTTLTTTTTTTTTTTSSMQFTNNNNQMNELPEGSRLFLVTPKDCTDDVLNKAVMKVLENEEFKLEPEDFMRAKVQGVVASGGDEDEEEEEQGEEVQNERKGGKNIAALEYARVGKGNKGVAFVKFTTKSAAEKFAKFVHAKLQNVLGDMKVKIMTAEKKKYTKNSSQYHQHNNTNSKNSLNTFSGNGVGGALSSGVFSENGNNEQGEISSQHRRGFLPKSNNSAPGDVGNVVVIGEATVGEVKGTLVFHPKVGVSDAIHRRFPTPPPLPKGLPPPQQRMQQMNIDSSNTAGMATRRPREYGDEETKARIKGTKLSKVESTTTYYDRNQRIDEDDAANDTKDEHINETDNIAAEAVTAMGLVTIKDGENTSATMTTDSANDMFAADGTSTKAPALLNATAARKNCTVVLHFETKLPLPVYVLSHAFRARLQSNEASSEVVSKFEVKATSALTGVVEGVTSPSPSSSNASHSFETLKGTFDICGVDCRVYSKDDGASKAQKVEKAKSPDIVQPPDESITEHERKRSRVETS